MHHCHITHWSHIGHTLVTHWSHIGHTLVTHWSPMLKWWSRMVKWSVSSLLFAISMIYDCMHPCHITHWALFAISMIYDCMHPCHITTLSHHKLVPNAQAGASPLDHHCSSPSLSCMTCHTCHITHWSQMAVSSLLFAILSWSPQITSHGHQALHLRLPTFLEWSISSLLFGILKSPPTQCSSSGLEWSNGQYRHCSSPSP